MNLKQVIQAGGWRTDGLLLAHLVPFAGDGGFHKITYNSCDPAIIKAKFDILQASGVDGVIFTWQGSTKPVNQQATLMMAMECARRGMTFALLADPWLYGTWQARGFASAEACIISELTSPIGAALLNSPAYLPEAYFLQFKADWNPATVMAAVKPTIDVLPIGVGFSWSVLPDLSALQQQNQNPAMRIPGVHWRFFDGGAPQAGGGLNYGLSSWGNGAAARGKFDRSGAEFFDSVSVLPIQSKYAALVTWDDTNEETGFEALCSIMSGIRIG